MREIKFRVCNTDYKFMDDDVYISGEGLVYQPPSIGYDTPYTEIEECGYPVMQCTGIKDKNGVEIYEGDIVKKEWRSINGLDRPFYMEVFRDDTGAWRVKYPIKTLDNVSSIKNQIEIVGNIYENPELLEGK